MSTPQDHYEALLAERYSWMAGGDFQAKALADEALLRDLLGETKRTGAAMDLGCGPGYQCAALAALGHVPVVGLDTSATLIAELQASCARLPVKGVTADIADLAHHAPPDCTTITCMGDTLTHLPDIAAVAAMLRAAWAALAPGGRFVATWRLLDLPLEGVARFIPVRSDADRIFTCFLEWKRDRVIVHDIIYERDDTGGWTLHASSYPKLIVTGSTLVELARDAGFVDVTLRPAGRLSALIAVK